MYSCLSPCLTNTRAAYSDHVHLIVTSWSRGGAAKLKEGRTCGCVTRKTLPSILLHTILVSSTTPILTSVGISGLTLSTPTSRRATPLEDYCRRQRVLIHFLIFPLCPAYLGSTLLDLLGHASSMRRYHPQQ